MAATPLPRNDFYLNAGGLGDDPVRGASILPARQRRRRRGQARMARPPPYRTDHTTTPLHLFDTSPLTAPLEILGAPALRLRVSATSRSPPSFVRLCEVRPDGSSWLVTWGALNLTHRDSMPLPNRSSRASRRVTIDLRAIAHRFAAGSRIRLSLSDGFWPMLWPSPEQAELGIAAGSSFIDLPVRPQETVAAPFPVPEVISAAEAPATYEPGSPGADGRIVLTNKQSRFAYPVAGPGTELSSEREETCDIVAGDFSTSHWRQRVRSGWKRAGWECEVEASYDVYCRDGAFHLGESLRAFENGKQVFSRASDATIPRDFA